MRENIVLVVNTHDFEKSSILSQNDILDITLYMIKVFITFNPQNNISVILEGQYVLPEFEKENATYMKYPRTERKFRKNVKAFFKNS